MNGQQRIGMFSALAGATLMVGALVAPATASATEHPEKVTICHASGLAGTTKFETLTIDWHAVYGESGHFLENGTPAAGHEQDYLGACHTDESTTTTAEVTTTTAEVTTTTAEVTTTTAAASTTTTVEATTTSLASEAPIPTTTAAASAGPVPSTAVLGDSGALPATGGTDGRLPVLGGVLLMLGMSLMALTRRHADV